MNIAPYAVLGFQALGGAFSGYQNLKAGMYAQQDAEIRAQQRERNALELSNQLSIKREQVKEGFGQYKAGLSTAIAGAGFSADSATSGDLMRMAEIKRNKQLAMIGYGGALQARAFHEEAASMRRKGRAAYSAGKTAMYTDLFSTGASMGNFGIQYWG